MAETVDLTESRQTEVLVVAWVMTGAAIFTVGIKLFARAKIVHVIGWDDFFIFLSLVRRPERSRRRLKLTQLRYSASSPRLSCTMEWCWGLVDIQQRLPRNLEMSDYQRQERFRCLGIVRLPRGDLSVTSAYEMIAFNIGMINIASVAEFSFSLTTRSLLQLPQHIHRDTRMSAT
jgi:hypothetical protein